MPTDNAPAFDRGRSRDVVRSFDLRALPGNFHDDPYRYYDALRTQDPVHKLPDGSYFLTRYADIHAVYRDAKTFGSDKKIEFRPKYGDSPLYEHHTTSLVFNDPPLHTRVRRLLVDALSPKATAAMEDPLVALVDGLLDAMQSKGDVDLIADFAAAIPVEVIGNLLGVPHDERAPLRDWSLAILGALEPLLSEDMAERGNRAVREFLSYLERLVARRRAAPGDPEKDVLTRLIRGEPAGERLSEAELLHNCIFILNAGHETTTNLIGNGLHALARRPEQKQQLIDEPGLVVSAVEEILRFESSNQLGNRSVLQTTVLGGMAMAPGTLITLCIGAGNRDPEQFAQPERFDVRRSPNRHLAFASGIHQCAGLHLARLEARVAVRSFLQRFPKYRLNGSPIRGCRARFRGLSQLPVTLE